MPFLAAGQPLNLPAVAGLPLDQGKGLQHRIVQVSGDFGAFPLLDPASPFVTEITDQPQPPGNGDDRDADQGQHHRDAALTGRR